MAPQIEDPDDTNREQWRAEQMNGLAESYSSWRDDYCRKHLKAPQPHTREPHQDAAPSYAETPVAA